MDLYSGTPYWMVKNPLWETFNPLRGEQTVRVAVIGAGITGALVAHALSESGIECCILDRRTPATGSSCASTALLQYEIDVPLCRMVQLMPPEDAVTAYRACLESISELEELFRTTGVDASFRRVPSLYCASNLSGLRLIRKEYELRRQHDLPVEYLGRKELRAMFGIGAGGALLNRVSAQIDTARAAVGLMRRDMRESGLRVFTHTEVAEWHREADGYLLVTAGGHRLRCEHVVVAAGFEAGPFLPRRLMELTTTFAIVSQPVDERVLWPGRSLIWETRDPYLYIRTDESNRIIVGGEDISGNDPARRRRLLPRKAAILERKFRKLFPQIPFKTEMMWAGTFSSTRDGLPLIGTFADDPRMWFALGYGGNGITFSVIASRIIARALSGTPDPRARVFSPERASLQG